MLIISIILILTLASACGADERKSTHEPPSIDASVARNPQGSGELALFHQLTRNYEPSVRPVRNHSKAVVVKLGLTLIKIVEVDVNHQTISVNCWLDQEWHDEFYVWNPVDFHGISFIQLPNKYIWNPDIELYNKADNFQSGQSESLAMIKHDGTVYRAPQIRLSSSCNMDLTYFPFDSQKCFLKFVSAYHGFLVDVTNRSSSIDFVGQVFYEEFMLVDVALKRRIVKYDCCPEPYPEVTFFLHLQRRPLRYIWTIFMPGLLVSGLSLLTYCLPFDSGKRATFGILVFLCYLLLFVSIQGKLPEYTNSVPLIGIYLLVVMGLMAISLVLTVVVVPNVDCLVQLATRIGQSNRTQDSSFQSKIAASNLGSPKKSLCPEFQNNEDKTGTQIKEERTEQRKEQIVYKSKKIIRILNAGLFLVMLLLTIVVPLVLVPLVPYNRKAEDNWADQLIL